MPPSPSVLVFDATPVQNRGLPVSSSEAASLGGKPAKTPIIAGTICGSVLLLAWGIGAMIYCRKRHNRKKQKRLAEDGLCEPPPEKTIPLGESERIVIPPDPAVLLGYAKPGDIGHPLAARTESIPLKKSRQPHSRSELNISAKQLPSLPAPLGSAGKHKKSRPHSSSKSATPKRSDTDDEITAPLNPREM